MIAAWWGYSYTQDFIYKKMGGTNGNSDGIPPTSAKNWYLKSPSQGGIGAVRSYLSTDRTITTAKKDLDKGLSFHSLTLSHSRVCAGYLIYFDHSGQDCLYLNDPYGGRQYWEALSGSPELQRIYVHLT